MEKYSIGSKVVHSPEGVCVIEAEKLVYIPVDSAIMKLLNPLSILLF